MIFRKKMPAAFMLLLSAAGLSGNHCRPDEIQVRSSATRLCRRCAQNMWVRSWGQSRSSGAVKGVARFTVTLSSGANMLPDQLGMYEVESAWRMEDGQWRRHTASWKRAT